MGGRSDLFEGLANIFESIGKIVEAIKEAFREIFPEKTEQDLANMTKGFKEFTEKLIPSKEALSGIQSIFRGVFSVIKIVIDAIKVFINIVGKIWDALRPVREAIFDVAVAIADWVSGINDSLNTSSAFEKVLKGTADVFTLLGQAINWAIEKIKLFFGMFSNKEIDVVKENSEGIVKATEPLINVSLVFSKIGEGFKKLWDIIKVIGGKLREALEYFFGGELHFDTIMHVLREIINLGILNGFRKIVDGIGETTLNFGNVLKSASNTIKNVGTGLKDMFDEIGGVFSAWKKEKIAEILRSVAISLLLLAAALFVLSKIDSERLWESMGSMTVMLGELIGSMAIISKILDNKQTAGFMKMSTLLISFSAAVLILASALKKISEIDPEKAGAGIIGITVLIGELVVAARLLVTDGNKKVLKAAGVLLGIAIAVDLLVIAVKQLSGVDWPDLGKGLLGIFGILMMLVASVNMMDKKIGVGTGAGLVLLATSLIIVGEAIKKIGSLDLDTLKFGLIGIALGLAAIVTALNFMPKNSLIKAQSISTVSLALLAISKSLEIVGNLGWDKMFTGLVGLGGGLLAISLALKAMSNPSSLAGASAILVTSAALLVLAGALKMAGSLGWDSMLQGLLGLTGLLALVAVASIGLSAFAPMILGAGAALAVFGASLLLCTIPLAILIDLVKSITQVGPTGLTTLNEFFLGLAAMIPEFAKQIGLGLVEFIRAIADAGPIIIDALSAIISSILDSLIFNIPKFFTIAEMILDGLLNIIIKYSPKIVEAGLTIILSLLRGIRDHIQEIVEVGVDIIVNFIKGIENSMPKLVDEAFNLMIVFIDTLGTTIRDKTPIVVDHVWDMAENIVKGLWEGLKHFLEKGKEKIANFGTFIIETIENVLGIPHGSIQAGASKFFDIGGQIITGMINGFKEGLKTIGEAISDVGNNIVTGFKNFFHIQSPSKLMRDEVGNYIVDGISEGIKKNTSAEEAAKIKAQNIANAFKTEIDKIDFSRQTSDLMNNLWSANQNTKDNRLNRLLEEEYAKEKPNEKYIQELEARLAKSEEERTLMQIEQTKGYLQDLQEKEKLAKGEYDVSVNTFGKDSDEAKKAWNSFLQAQINTIEKQNELEDLEYTYSRDKKEQAEKQRKQNEQLENSYYEWIIKNTKALKQFGYTTEEIEKAASDATGFDPKASQVKMEDATKEATLNSMKAVNETYQANAEDTFGSLNPEFESYGQQYGANLAKGLESEKGLVVSESTALSQGSLAALNDHTNEYYEAGKEAGKAYTEGLKEYSSQALNTSNGLYSKSNDSLREAYSKKANEMKSTYNDVIKQIAQKEGVDMGVAFDMLKANARGGSYGSGIIYDKNALTKDYKELEDISKAIANDNVSSVLKSGGDATAIVSTVGIKSYASSSSARSTSSSISSSSSKSSNSSSSNSGTTINYTQNISSPKATSNSEIYRSSKTALSAISSIISSVSPIGGAVSKIASSLAN